MDPKTKRNLIVRVPEPRDRCDWDILSPEGTPIEGWHFASVGIDHSGRYSLHLVFDQFDCVNADGQPIDIELAGVTHKPFIKERPLPSPRSHKIREK